MGDVEIFRAELTGASGAINAAVTELLLQAADLQGEDVGIENPASRTMLRLEMHRRLSALHDAAMARLEAGSHLAAAAQRIADGSVDLDEELTGRSSP